MKTSDTIVQHFASRDETRTPSTANEILTRDIDSDTTADYTLAYDKPGNLTDDGSDYTYVYDAFGRLRQRTQDACLDLLAEGAMCVSDMVPRLGWMQPEVSRALVALRELGLVEFVISTRHHLYRLGPAVTVRNNGHAVLRVTTADRGAVTLHRAT